MKILSPVFCALASFVVFSSCEKDPDPQPQPKTKTELISQGTWKFQAATANGFDISGQIACFTDNVITVSANGSGNVDEGANVCNPTTAGPFTWNFQNSETEIFVSKVIVNGGSNVWSIQTLNETNLVMSQNVTIPPNPTFNVVLTLKH